MTLTAELTSRKPIHCSCAATIAAVTCQLISRTSSMIVPRATPASLTEETPDRIWPLEEPIRSTMADTQTSDAATRTEAILIEGATESALSSFLPLGEVGGLDFEKSTFGIEASKLRRSEAPRSLKRIVERNQAICWCASCSKTGNIAKGSGRRV